MQAPWPGTKTSARTSIKPSPSAEKKDEFLGISSQIESVLTELWVIFVDTEPVGSSRKARLDLFKENPAFHPDKFGAKNPRNNSLQRLSPNGFLFSRNNSRHRTQQQLGSISIRLQWHVPQILRYPMVEYGCLCRCLSSG